MADNPFKRGKGGAKIKAGDAALWAVFDLDDTLTHAQWRAHHLDKEKNGGRANWSAFFEACGEDPPAQHMLDCALEMQAAGIKLAFWTGRLEKQRQTTLGWLDRHGIAPGFELLMRGNGIFRKDHEIKKVWLEEALAAGRQIVCGFDDREQNRAVFEAQGVRCADPLRADQIAQLTKLALERARASRESRPAPGV